MSEANPTAPVAPADQITDEMLNQHLRVQVVDMSSGIESEAIQAADADLSERTTEGGVKGVVKRIWYGNIARDYVRRKGIKANRDLIEETGNLYAAAGESAESYDEAASVTVKRFLHEADLLHEGESNQDLADVQGGHGLENGLRWLVGRYSSGAMDREALEEGRTSLLNLWGSTLAETDKSKGKLFADNIIEVAEAAKAAFDHGVSMDRISAALAANAGEARLGVRGEVPRDKVDRALERIQGNPVGQWLNESTVGVAVTGVALSASRFVTRKAWTALATTVSMGAGAGIVGGLRERLRVTQERQLHGRQIAEGGEVEPSGGSRREAMEATRYETVSAESLTDRLSGASERLATGNHSPESLREVLAELAHASTRIKLSDELGADFITFDSKTSVERQRLDLDILVATLKVDLETAASGLSNDQRIAAGMPINVSEALEGLSDWTAEIMTGDMSAKDQAFRKLRRSRMAKMATVSFVTAGTMGLAMQEVKAQLGDYLQGMGEGQQDGQHSRTILRGLIDGEQAHHSGADPTQVSENGLMALPDGYKLQEHTAGYSLLDPRGNSLTDHLQFDEAGHLDKASQQLLESKGVSLHETSETIAVTTTETIEVTRTPDDFINAHPEQFTRVSRELWFDNNTPGSFDQNELKLHWGGDAGVDANGNYIFNVSHMLPEGSFHGDQAANFQQAIDSGQLKIAISLDRSTQHAVQMINIDANGNAVIDRNSFVGQSAFALENGKARFTGGFAEAVQVMGTNEEGKTTTRMLATVVGSNESRAGTDTITNVVDGFETKITTVIDAPAQPTEIAPILPIYGRKGLESLATKEQRISYNYGYNRYGVQSPEDINQLLADTLPALIEDSRAEIPIDQATAHYEEVLRTRYGDQYPEELRQVIQQQEALRTIDSGTKAILTIPVEAIAEGGNIYNTLKLYAALSPEELASTKILLHLNWMDSRAQTPEAQASIQRTRDEIARAVQDFPALQVASFESQWTDEQQRQGGGVVGLAVRKLYDVAIMSVRDATESGQVAPDQEVVLVRNDADPNGLSPNYLANMVEATVQPRRDATVGKFKWGIEKSADLPGLFLATQFLSGIQNSAERAMRKGIDAGVPTSGANMGVRISTLAAVGSVGFGSFTGAGSDDLELGERINALRRSNSPTRQAISRRRLRPGYSSSVAVQGPSRPYGLSGGASADDDASTIGRGVGLVIDTDASRLERMYRDGKSIVQAWVDFDEDGYRSRTDGLSDDGAKESLIDDPDAVCERAEFQINTLIAGWAMSTAHVEMELRRLFPSNKPGETPMYTTDFNANGIVQFHFTESGKKLLVKRLTRNNRGQFDPIGSRRMRTNYGRDTSRRAFPVNRTPHLISARR